MASMGRVLEVYAQLTKEKDQIEAEIQAIVDELTSGSNAPGLKGSLVDSEGFPRADIDVYRVRHQRHRFACLQTDHQGIMKKIEAMLPSVFEARKLAAASSQSSDFGGEGKASNSIDRPTLPAPSVKKIDPGKTLVDRQKLPFAVVQDVRPDSPASTAGLEAGDEIIEFGSADASNHRDLQALRDIVLHHFDRPIRVLIQRPQPNGQLIEIALTPMRWSGNGVLGCQFTPISLEP